MISSSENKFSLLQTFLNRSLFSILPVSVDFDDKKALSVIELINGYTQQFEFNDEVIMQSIRHRLIEAIGRNVGQGEDYGSGFPFDLMEKYQNELEFNIETELIDDILEWSNTSTFYEFATLTTDETVEYFYRVKEKPLELIPYSTVALLSFEIIENAFQSEFKELEQLCMIKIPDFKWKEILDKGDSIEKYL